MKESEKWEQTGRERLQEVENKGEGVQEVGAEESARSWNTERV